MSTFSLSVLVGTCLLVLIVIAYGINRWEQAKVHRSKLATLHRDRFKDLGFLIDVLPKSAISREMLCLLVRNLVMHLEKSVELDPGNTSMKQRLVAVRQLAERVYRGEALPKPAPMGSIGDQIKDVQRALKILKEFILQQHKGGFLTKESAKENIKSLHQINLTAMVNGLMQQAKFNLGEGNISLGLHYYQLALSEISKSRQSGEILFEEKQFIGEEIKRIKAQQKAQDTKARAGEAITDESHEEVPLENVGLEKKVQAK